MSKLTKFIKSVLKSNNIVFFGGAGVSTASGIPDFRSKEGLYKQNLKAEEMLSLDFFKNNPEEFFKFYFEDIFLVDKEPNVCHEVLKQLEDLNKLKSVITQNIDGLHQKAGSKNVLELHGSIYNNYCEATNKFYDIDYIIKQKNAIPKTEEGHVIRPAITLYGEPPFEEIFEKAINEIQKAEILIVAGTSLKVYPAAALIHYFDGKKIYVIDKENVKIENSILVKKDIEKVFTKLKNKLK